MGREIFKSELLKLLSDTDIRILEGDIGYDHANEYSQEDLNELELENILDLNDTNIPNLRARENIVYRILEFPADKISEEAILLYYKLEGDLEELSKFTGTMEVYIYDTPINPWAVSIQAFDFGGQELNKITSSVTKEERQTGSQGQWITDHIFEIISDINSSFGESFDITYYHNGTLIDEEEYEEDYYTWLDSEE